LTCAELLKKRIQRELTEAGKVPEVPEDHPRLKPRVINEYIKENIKTLRQSGYGKGSEKSSGEVGKEAE